MNRTLFARQLAVGLVTASGLVACNGERPRQSSQRAQPVAAPKPKTVPAVHMPGAIARAESQGAEAPRASPQLKNEGKLGERLEGDVYYFRLKSLRLCDGTGKLAGVEVEIEAKSRLSVSPRDVVIGKGGIAFHASMNSERRLPGCTPLLDISTLQRGEVAAGFVLFDLPHRPGNDLGLIYQPTRWGGAGFVRSSLEGWSTPP